MGEAPRIAVGRISANCETKRKARSFTDKREFPRVEMASSWLSESTREEFDVDVAVAVNTTEL